LSAPSGADLEIADPDAIVATVAMAATVAAPAQHVDAAPLALMPMQDLTKAWEKVSIGIPVAVTVIPILFAKSGRHEVRSKTALDLRDAGHGRTGAGGNRGGAQHDRRRQSHT
jgi:hypothetical protein